MQLISLFSLLFGIVQLANAVGPIYTIEGYRNVLLVPHPNKALRKNGREVWQGVNNITGELHSGQFLWWFSDHNVWNYAWTLTPPNNVIRYGYLGGSTNPPANKAIGYFDHNGVNSGKGILRVRYGKVMTACIPTPGTLSGEAAHIGDFDNVPDCAEAALIAKGSSLKGVYLDPVPWDGHKPGRAACRAVTDPTTRLIPQSPYQLNGHRACILRYTSLPGTACCGSSFVAHGTAESLDECAKKGMDAELGANAASWNSRTKECRSYVGVNTVDTTAGAEGWKTAFIWNIVHSTTTTTTVTSTSTTTVTTEAPKKGSSVAPIAGAAGGLAALAGLGAAGGGMYFRGGGDAGGIDLDFEVEGDGDVAADRDTAADIGDDAFV